MKIKLVIISVLLSNSCFLLGQSSNGWENLFDGKTLSGWTRMAGTAEYKVEDGAIVGATVLNSPNSFLVFDKKYKGDFILELEAKMDDTTANSGVQFKSNFDPNGNDGKGKIYGYQFELDPSFRSWSGGLYDEGRRDWLYPLELHSDAKTAFRQGEYNKIHIECFGNTIKTWLNGIAVAYLVDTITANAGLIGLQVHSIGDNTAHAGKKVFFKNIRIKTKGIAATGFSKGIYVLNFTPNNLTEYEKKDGWELLFDGKSPKGWRGAYKDHFPDTGWTISNGELTVLSSEGKEAANGGDIITLNQYRAFDLSFEFKLTPGANSGVKYFVTLSEHNQGSAIGLEYQVLDDKLHPDAKLGRDGDRTLASLYDLIPAKKQDRFLRPIGQWNEGRVIVYPNNHVEHYLNGVKVLEYDRGSAAFKELVAISKFQVWKNFGEAKEGHILLQDHGNQVSYRSIKIKPL